MLAITLDSLDLRKRNLDINNTLIEVKNAGYEGIDVSLIDLIKDEPLISYEKNLSTAKAWRSMLDNIGLIALQAHAPIVNFLECAEEKRLQFMQAMLQAIEICEVLGVKWLVVHPGSLDDEDNIEKQVANNVYFFHPIIQHAQIHNVGIAFENMIEHPEKTGSRSHRRFASTAYELQCLITGFEEALGEEITSGQGAIVGICWDFGHAEQSNLNQAKSLELLKKYIRALHVTDTKGKEDEHTIPYLGRIQWASFSHVLENFTSEISFTLEIHKFMNQIPDELFIDALAFTAKVGSNLQNKLLREVFIDEQK